MRKLIQLFLYRSDPRSGPSFLVEGTMLKRSNVIRIAAVLTVVSAFLSLAVVCWVPVSAQKRSIKKIEREEPATQLAEISPKDEAPPAKAPAAPLVGPELIYATSGSDIAQFSSGATGVVSSVPLSGMQAGETMVGIDLRPATGQIYGVGSSSRLYIINPGSGVVTQVGSAGAFTLNGTSFAVDFNPVPDRLRVISNTGQNIRINPNDGSLAATDTSITPAGVTISGGAYDRNDLDPATGTTLYGIDSTNGVLTTVGSINGSPNSPNGGVVGPTVGSLGLGTGLDPRIGFDISAGTATAYATMLTGGTDKLYTINLATGAATLVGTIGTGTTIYSGMTAATAPTPPVGGLLYATSGSDIAQFSSGATGVVTSVPLTGLQAGETLVGIDLRPATGQLYGVGSSSRLYIINPGTGAVTQIGSAGAFTLGGTSFAVDFNPVVDRLRVISNTGQNIRINPADGSLAATDTSITPAGVTITGGAYDRNDRAPATGTTLYGIDSTNGVLTTVGSINGSPNSPNSGIVGPTVGSLGLGTGLDPRIGFDISAGTGTAYASMLTGGTDKLYTINLATGAATLVGTVGTGTTVYSGLTAASVPTAASVSISGRVTTANGIGIKGATVRLTDGTGGVRIALTNAFGYYSFDSVDAGSSYLMTAVAKRYTFSAQLIAVVDTLTELNFAADQ
jgi:hypothetical protein